MNNFFYLDDEIVDHSLVVDTVLKVLAMLGGHIKFITIIFGKIAKQINKNVTAAKLIRSNYYIHRPDEMKGHNHQSSITYDLITIHLDYFNKCFKYNRYKKDKSINKKELFKKGLERLNNDLCVFNIL